jgi:hypothetical protein
MGMVALIVVGKPSNLEQTKALKQQGQEGVREAAGTGSHQLSRGGYARIFPDKAG